MNDKIKELAEKCGFRSNPNIYDRNQSFDIEKFAELLVKECMDLCEQVAADAHQQKDSSFLTADGKQLYNGVWGGAMNCISKIKNHFGVE